MILGNKHLVKNIKKGRIICDPLNIDNIGPNSIDVTLGPKLYRVVPNQSAMIGSFLVPQKLEEVTLFESGFLIYPGHLYLGATVETIGSNYFVPVMHGRSTVARHGVSPIVSAGYGDVGFIGQWTLEITTQAFPIFIKPGMRIAQIEFSTVSDRGFLYSKKGHYAGQKGATAGVANNV